MVSGCCGDGVAVGSGVAVGGGVGIPISGAKKVAGIADEKVQEW